MTSREYYELLVETSRTGGFPAVDRNDAGNFRCRYRAADGRRCGVGLVMPDDVYEPRMEGEGIESFYNDVAPAWLPDGVGVVDAAAVQFAHDRTALGVRGRPIGWDHAEFVASLKDVPCFAGFAAPEEQPPV